MTALKYGATTQVFDPEKKYKHLAGTPAAIVVCIGCGQKGMSTAYMLSVPRQVANGCYYSGVVADFCSEVCAKSWLETKFNPYTSPLPTNGLPSQEHQEVWIYAFRNQGDYPSDTERSGKWLVWYSPQVVDNNWDVIRRAVELGKLGDYAKVSTAASGRVKAGKDHVICVHTYDCTDRSDVMRVREVLRRLGIQRSIIYKGDEDTDSGRYGRDYAPKYRA